jgi:mannose-6-phosphate isomerase-like protein (cupin superfamily)
MDILDARSYRAERPWGAYDVANLENASVRLHWTDKPYNWHVNDGVEVFVVLDGLVDMHVRNNGVERVVRVSAGDVLRVATGDEHFADPIGEARILVIERRASRG